MSILQLSQGETPIFSIVKNNNQELFDHFEPITDFKIRNYNKESLLFFANSEKLASKLMDKDVDPNLPNRDGILPIFTKASCPEVFQALLDGKTNIEAINPQNGQTILMVAVESGNESVVNSVLKNKVQINLADKSEQTALHHAATIDEPAIVQQLLNHGAEPEIVDNLGENPVCNIHKLCQCSFVFS
jgi:ankyrin repeat protein